MRHLWMAAGLIAVSCLIAGCDSGSSSTVTPEEDQSAQDALKKWQQDGHSKPTGKQSSGSTAADIANKKQRRH
jgi:hypothetical protein